MKKCKTFFSFFNKILTNTIIYFLKAKNFQNKILVCLCNIIKGNKSNWVGILARGINNRPPPPHHQF